MGTGWWHRAAGIFGTVALTTVAVAVANYPAVQHAFALVPFFGNPAPVVLSGGALSLVIWTTLAVVVVALWPLYKPRPRRVLDTIVLAQKRVLLAMVGLAAPRVFQVESSTPPEYAHTVDNGVALGELVWVLCLRRRERKNPESLATAIVV